MKSSRRVIAAILALSVVVVGMHLVFFDGVPGQVTYCAVTVGAAGAAWLGVRRHVGERRHWRLVAFGLALSAAADVVWALYVVYGGGAPEGVSWADPLWLASYLALGAGLALLLLRASGRRRADVDGLVDLGLIAVLGLLVVGPSVAANLGDTEVSVLTRGVWASYPLLDAGLIALVLRLMVSRGARSAGSAALVVGACCWMASDLVWMLQSGASSFEPLLDTGWLVGNVLLAASTWLAPAADAAASRDAEVEPVGLGRVALAVVPLLAPPVAAVLADTGPAADPIGLLTVTAALVGLALVRAVRLLQRTRAAQEELADRQAYYRALSTHSSDAVVVLDTEGCIVNDAPNLGDLLGYREVRVKGVNVLQIVRRVDQASIRRVFDEAIARPGDVVETEVRVRNADGEERWLAARFVNMLAEPAVGGIVVHVQDATARKRAEGELAHRASHDSLTGLANRVLLSERIERALANGVPGEASALLYIDLDGFKHVNDSLGHEAGDLLLRGAADRLTAVVRPTDTVARVGGDEFAVLLAPDADSLEHAVDVADRALRALTEPLDVRGQTMTVTASIGIAVAGDAATAESLLRDADVAMYQAKTSGKNRRVAFEAEMRDAVIDQLALEIDLADALARGELRLVYQPVVELESDRLVGFEALLRWEHPRHGLLAPETFLPVAERTGAILPIGRWVLAKACLTASRWQAAFGTERPLTMAVNVSAVQLGSSDLDLDVAEALAGSGLTPASLVLEVSESTLAQDPTLAVTRLGELRRLGVRLAVDDFGTGYASLSQLRKLPIDILKIDRSLVRTITERSQIPAIVRGLLDVGRSLELDIVAEGVEYGVQREWLRQENCDLAQGFLFATPLTEIDAEALLVRAATDDGARSPRGG